MLFYISVNGQNVSTSPSIQTSSPLPSIQPSTADNSQHPTLESIQPSTAESIQHPTAESTQPASLSNGKLLTTYQESLSTFSDTLTELQTTVVNSSLVYATSTSITLQEIPIAVDTSRVYNISTSPTVNISVTGTSAVLDTRAIASKHTNSSVSLSDTVIKETISESAEYGSMTNTVSSLIPNVLGMTSYFALPSINDFDDTTVSIIASSPTPTLASFTPAPTTSIAGANTLQTILVETTSAASHLYPFDGTLMSTTFTTTPPVANNTLTDGLNSATDLGSSDIVTNPATYDLVTDSSTMSGINITPVLQPSMVATSQSISSSSSTSDSWLISDVSSPMDISSTTSEIALATTQAVDSMDTTETYMTTPSLNMATTLITSSHGESIHDSSYTMPYISSTAHAPSTATKLNASTTMQYSEQYTSDSSDTTVSSRVDIYEDNASFITHTVSTPFLLSSSTHTTSVLQQPLTTTDMPISSTATLSSSTISRSLAMTSSPSTIQNVTNTTPQITVSPGQPITEILSNNTVNVTKISTRNKYKIYHLMITFDGDCDALRKDKILQLEFLKAMLDVIMASTNLQPHNIKAEHMLCEPLRVFIRITYLEHEVVDESNVFEDFKNEVVSSSINVQILDEMRVISFTATDVEIITEEEIESTGLETVDIVIISLAAFLFIVLLFMMSIVLCRECYVRKHRSTFNLTDIPHVNLKLSDFSLTRIPRPQMLYRGNSRVRKPEPIPLHRVIKAQNDHTRAHSPDRVRVNADNIHVRMSDHKDGLVVGVTYSNPPSPKNDSSSCSSSPKCEDQSKKSLIKERSKTSSNGVANPIYYADEDSMTVVIQDDENEQLL